MPEICAELKKVLFLHSENNTHTSYEQQGIGKPFKKPNLF